MDAVNGFIELANNLLGNAVLPDWLKTLLFVTGAALLLALAFKDVLLPLWGFLRGLYEKITSRLFIDRHMYPYFTELTPREVYEHIRYYIHTRYSKEDPANNEELYAQKFSDEQEREGYPLLLNRFLDTEFDSSKNNRFYFVLADCGMGKTTFLMNLFYYTLLRKKRHPCKYINMVNQGVIDAVKEIKEESGDKTAETILLLDALDENAAATKNYAKFMSELEKETREFYCVVITSRTSFFEKAEEEQLPGFERGGRVTKDKIVKFYITPFTDNDIKKYLKRRYPWNRKKQKRAWAMMENNKNLAARPMLLKFMDELLNDNFNNVKGKDNLTSFSYFWILLFFALMGFLIAPFSALSLILSLPLISVSIAHLLPDTDIFTSEHIFQPYYDFQIYKKLFELWISRECDKNGQNDDVLREECYEIAKAIYHKWKTTGEIGISIEELKVLNILIPDIKLKGHALLNRTSTGKFKFSHKSYWEYLLAYLSLYRSDSTDEINFHYFDRGDEFFLEMVSQFDPYYAALFLNAIGEYRIDSDCRRVVFLLSSDIKNNLTVDKIRKMGTMQAGSPSVSVDVYSMFYHSCVFHYLESAVILPDNNKDGNFKKIIAGIAKYHKYMEEYFATEDKRIQRWHDMMDMNSNHEENGYGFISVAEAATDYLKAKYEFLKRNRGKPMG